ncbi:hypothetical protein Lal_00026763 [Lupinus albus]|nr:hypothetical protein Lal_00026763 [Lupinus albus]
MKDKESAFSCSSQTQTLNLIDVEANGVNVNGIKYPTLHRIARYLLAISISIIASKYCRCIDVSLDWLRGDMKGSSNSKLDIIGCDTILGRF